MSALDQAEVAEIMTGALDGSLGIDLVPAGWKFTSLDVGEIYARTANGDHFRLICEPVSPDDIEGWGIEFD